MKPKRPTLTPKTSDLVFMSWHVQLRKTREVQTKEMQVQSVSFCLRALLAALADLHMHWCTYIDERDRENIDGKEMKNWKKKVKEQIRTTELLIKQGVVRLQNMWWVEYQRVKVGYVVGKKYQVGSDFLLFGKWKNN